MKLLFLANPTAAGRRARPLLPAIRDVIARQAPGFDYYESQDAADLRRQAESAARAGYERVLVAGGDGSAHAAVNALRGTQAALGVIPLGHGNDLARALGVPLNPLAAVQFLLKAPVVSIDLARVGDIVYACVAGVGLDAATNRRANAWSGQLTGHTRYFLTALYTLASYWAIRVEMTSDTESFSGEVMWVAVANAPNYGGGLRIAPRARLDDGRLDVCIIERISTPVLLRLYPSILRGTHNQSPHVRSFRASRVRLQAPEGAELYGDGEFLARLPLEITVEPAALRVLGRLP
ncbi:MAG TPA: diacylglycerol kinase family protein [Candidatus Xenobia bacterium]|nr:diacylglycerol kinase family protein [Candidatus Xenobia bacterium]